MTQQCAAEGCTHEGTVVWQPGLQVAMSNSGSHGLSPVAFYRPSYQDRVWAIILLCHDHAGALKSGREFQFIHKAIRYTFDGKEIVPYAAATRTD